MELNTRTLSAIDASGFTLTLYASDNAYEVCVQDRQDPNNGANFFGDTIDDAILEAVLASGEEGILSHKLLTGFSILRDDAKQVKAFQDAF